MPPHLDAGSFLHSQASRNGDVPASLHMYYCQIRLGHTEVQHYPPPSIDSLIELKQTISMSGPVHHDIALWRNRRGGIQLLDLIGTAPTLELPRRRHRSLPHGVSKNITQLQIAYFQLNCCPPLMDMPHRLATLST
jgi:hypothetical protein